MMTYCLSLMRRSSFLTEKRLLFTIHSTIFIFHVKFSVSVMFWNINMLILWLYFSIVSPPSLNKNKKNNWIFTFTSHLNVMDIVQEICINWFLFSCLEGWGYKISFWYWWSKYQFLEGKAVIYLALFKCLRFLFDKWLNVVMMPIY